MVSKHGIPFLCLMMLVAATVSAGLPPATNTVVPTEHDGEEVERVEALSLIHI